MADLAASDLTALSAFIVAEFDDQADLFPEAGTLATMIASIAPRCVEQLNLYGRTPLGRAGLGLYASFLEAVKVGVGFNLLRDAYRMMPSGEIPQVELWRDEW